ncbi:MAG TPA: hypothetical protein VLJ76_09690 [Gaiellaceae bacterium]|nr:hypothetical protein [Gaiellaceae bacterium]
MTKQDEQQPKHDEPALEPETVKDLDVEEQNGEQIRGGQSGGVTRPGSVVT